MIEQLRNWIHAQLTALAVWYLDGRGLTAVSTVHLERVERVNGERIRRTLQSGHLNTVTGRVPRVVHRLRADTFVVAQLLQDGRVR